MLPPDFMIHQRYRIIYVVDERPGSQIYRTRDEQTGHLALVARLPAADDEARRDIELLVRQVAALRQDVLLPITDHFALDDAYAVVCEDPPGQDLDRALRARGGPLPEADVLTQARRLIIAVEHLHSQRPPLYLGDPQPGDLWIGADGAWQLTPFALIRAIDHAPSPYRAPELSARDAEPTPASDLYAIGAMLYQALTGWAPPTAEQQQTGTPLTGPRALNPAISPLAEQALLRSLQVKAANRYQAAREMRLALETVKIMDGRSLGLGPDVVQAPPNEPSPAIYQPPASTPPPPPAVYSPPAAAPAESASYSTALPGQPYNAADYPAPAERRRGFSTGCLVGLAVALTILAIGVCAVLAMVVGIIPTPQPLAGFGATSATTVAPTSVAAPTAAGAPAPTSVPAPTSAPAPTIEPANLGPRAITLQNADQITQTRELTGSLFGPALFSPDGALLAVGIDHEIYLRDADTLTDRTRLAGHTGPIYVLAFAPDGSLLASGAIDDPVIRLWDPATGRLIRTLEGHTGWIRGLDFAPDGKTLASSSTDTTIRLWDLASGSSLRTFSGHTGLVGGVVFAPNGNTLASSSRDGTVRLWDVATGAQREDFKFQTPIDVQTNARYWTTGIAFSPDGRLLAVGAIDGIVRLLDATTGAEQRRLEGHTDWVVLRGVVFAPDGKMLATASQDGTIRLWDVESGAERAKLEGHQLRVISATFSSDGRRIASTSDQGGQLLIWDVQQARIAASSLSGQGLITSMAFSSDGTLLGAAGFNGAIRIHLLDQNRVNDIAGSVAASQALAFLPDNRLAAITDQGTIVVLTRGDPQGKTLDGLDGEPLNVAVSRNGALIAAGSNTGTIGIWETSTGAAKTSIRSGFRTILALTINNDGSLVAVTGLPSEPTIEIWNTDTGKLHKTLPRQPATISGLAFQPRGALIAATDLNGALRLWDTQNGESIRTIEAGPDQQWFTSLAFSPDGTMIVTAAPNGDIRFWNAGTGEEVARTSILDTSLLALVFSPDGQQLAVSGRDGSIRIFTLPSR